jgi:RimJ/RimL family protein N-acetyltransferase
VTGTETRSGSLVIADAGVARIRRRVRADAIDEFRWRKDPELARYDAATPVPSTFSHFLAAFEFDLEFGRAGRETFALDSPEGTHIGSIMYYNADGESAELGISIADPAYRGRGVGRAVIVAFLRWLWNSRPVRRLQLHTLAWNERAQRSFRAAGFEDAARVSRNGQWFVRMEARREWWLLWDGEGRFEARREEPESESA